MKPMLRLLPLFVILIICRSTSCKREPYYPDFMTINGTIIGKELCNTDSSKNYWLVDLKPTINVPDYGDTLIVGDSTYNHVVKVKGLYKPLQKIGLNVVFDFKQISQHNVQSTDCNIPSPITYEIKELYIINQGIRTP